MKVKIEKIKELEDAVHPNNIEEGFQRIEHVHKDYFKKPTIGERFWLSIFSTSKVTEIINDNTFRTLNSIYKWEVVE